MRLRELQYTALATVTMWAWAAGESFGQAGTTPSGGNSSFDPSAPLKMLEAARTKASSSQLNAANIATGGNNAGMVISVIFAVVGIALAGFSGVKLYKSAQDDNAREDSGRSLAGLVIGSAITILGVIIGVVTTYMTGTGTSSS